MQTVPVARHEDEVSVDARERIKQGDWPTLYRGHHVECPGCAQPIYKHDTDEHAARCQPLRDLVLYEADAHRDAQPARLSGGAS